MRKKAKDISQAAKHVDWIQHLIHQEVPCFFIENRRFCGRGRPWEGHGVFHNFVPLYKAIDAAIISERGAKK